MNLNKLTLAITAVAGMTATTAFADTDVTVYGKLNVSVQNVDDGSDSTTELQSNASRLGFKGKTDLTENTAVIYKMEYEVDVDGEGSDVFKQRNIYVGLTGGLGTVFVGKHDTALKMAQGKVDVLNDLDAGDIKNILLGETRAANIISYTTPKFAGFSATIQPILNEGEDITGDGKAEDSVADSFSSSINWKNDNFYVALAHDNNVATKSKLALIDGDTSAFDNTRLVGQAKVAGFTFGAMAQQSVYQGDQAVKEDTFSGYTGSVSYTINKIWKVYGQIAQSDMPVSFADTDNNESYGVGIDYNFSKATKVFGFYNSLEATENVTKDSKEETVAGIGISHKF
ncbi:Major outer membrane protein P.IB [Sinobacterium norvegicum]|uniref:Major outer membrane protein P.IB n=1 Tax=Sinobacterium norvegicum TaxID=1641715 RepID=A0ABM9AJ94_9GAMM|nr:porin [Sinobacterium norvegicum]CAH0993293.1 Major outer membrane protein P.IB [Sinobacterium norvegicum]